MTLPSSSMCRIICSTCDSGEFLLSGYGMLSSYIQNSHRKINQSNAAFVRTINSGKVFLIEEWQDFNKLPDTERQPQRYLYLPWLLQEKLQMLNYPKILDAAIKEINVW